MEWNETAICHQENLVPFHTAQEEFENGGFTLKTQQMFLVHTRKRIKCFPSTLHRRNLKTQQSQAAETLECTREHGFNKHGLSTVLVEPTWLNQQGNHQFRPPFWICVWGRLGQTNYLIIVTSSFSKSSVFGGQFLRIGVDGRPKPRPRYFGLMDRYKTEINKRIETARLCYWSLKKKIETSRDT